MVASFITAANRTEQRWTYLVQIEAIGDADGLHTWSLERPDYAEGDARYERRDTFSSLPGKPTHERAPYTGGMTEAGAVTVELVDYDDLITAAVGTERPPVAQLAAFVSATATTITVNDATDLPASGAFVIYLGAEAVLIASRVGVTLTVASGGRGWLRTDARSHREGEQVYLSSPFLRTRRMYLYLAPTDADSEAVALEYTVGTYRIDRIGWSQNLGVWSLGGATEARDLGRLVCSRMPGAFRVDAVNGINQVLWSPVAGSRGALDLGRLDQLLFYTWPDRVLHLRNGDGNGEVLEAEVTDGTTYQPIITGRGRGNTEIGEVAPGDVLRPVLLGDSAFRVSPGPTPSESRSSGSWPRTTHPVDQMLCALTSSAHPDDGLELLNYVAAWGNWSSLPVGYGIGYPAARIDFGSWVAIREATRHLSFPALVFGETTETFAEWATRNFLRPLGWYVVVVDGLLTLIAPRLLLEGETPAATIDVNDILEISSCDIATDVVAGVVVYRYKGPGGYDHTTTVKASDFGSLFGSRAQYTLEDDAIEIEVPGVRADQSGLVAFLIWAGQRLLFRTMRPPMRLAVEVDSSFHALREGNVVEVTHPDLPNLRARRRGWTAVLAMVTYAGPLYLDDEGGVRRRVEVLAYPSFLSRRVAPSAMITGVTGAGPWTCTVAANRYTAPNADLAGLDVSDAAVFEVGDRLKTITRAGVEVFDRYEVDSVGVNEIVVSDGDGNAPTVGDVLVFDVYVDAVERQQTRFAAWAGANNTIAAGVPAVIYGES